jgi:hypothetical protein
MMRRVSIPLVHLSDASIVPIDRPLRPRIAPMPPPPPGGERWGGGGGGGGGRTAQKKNIVHTNTAGGRGEKKRGGKASESHDSAELRRNSVRMITNEARIQLCEVARDSSERWRVQRACVVIGGCLISRGSQIEARFILGGQETRGKGPCTHRVKLRRHAGRAPGDGIESFSSYSSERDVMLQSLRAVPCLRSAMERVVDARARRRST